MPFWITSTSARTRCEPAKGQAIRADQKGRRLSGTGPGSRGQPGYGEDLANALTCWLNHMKLGVLFSGGKDSVFACWRAREKNEIACLITLVSENPDSYMFHTPNIRCTDLQAEAMGFPLLSWPTHGVKEEELEDLMAAVAAARDQIRHPGSRHRSNRVRLPGSSRAEDLPLPGSLVFQSPLADKPDRLSQAVCYRMVFRSSSPESTLIPSMPHGWAQN